MAMNSSSCRAETMVLEWFEMLLRNVEKRG